MELTPSAGLTGQAEVAAIDGHGPASEAQTEAGSSSAARTAAVDTVEMIKDVLVVLRSDARAGVKCQDCHMGKATKSAAQMGQYEGDVWTHIFAIDTGADYDMFNRDHDGNTVSAKGALSLEYACFRCHADADKAEYSAIENYHTLGS